jgi:hypothetical protein
MNDELKPEVAVDDSQDKAIEIDLDKPAGTPPTSSEPKYVTVDDLEKIRKQLNGLSYMGRQFNELSKKLDGLQYQPQQKVQADGTKDPYDEMVEKDWKQAVRTLAREEAQAIRQQQIQQENQRQLEQQKVNILEQSKQKVMSKYPEINDQDSEIAKKYMKILSQNQDYLRNDRGPLLAMRDMEDELRDEGRLDEVSKRAVEKEVNRQVRTGAATLPRTSNGATNSNKISLTREQKELCDNHNIRYEDYASMLKKQQVSGRQGVEV